MKSKTIQLGILLSLFFASSAVAQKQPKADTPNKNLVTFYAMGDVPYKPPEDLLLPKQITELPKDAEFVIHVGDIKGGGAPCDEAVYNKVFGMLSQSKAPVFIIPGDNEWNDCQNPAQAWEYWNKYFMRFDRQWQHRLPLFRQIKHEENFSFVKNNVLFIGLNIVGGRINDAAEWKQRHLDGLDWVRRNLSQFGSDATSLVLFIHAKPNVSHADFFDPFMTDAKEFKKPILLLHGDGHKWMYDRPFKAQNILRIQVDQGGIAPPLKVIVSNHPNKPFQFDRRNGKPAK